MSENSEIVPVEVHESEITVQNSCVSLVSDLRTQGASVYLPEKKILKPATEEYREIFLNSVPPDMAEDIGAILKQRHKHLSFLGGCIIAVFLLATVVMLYFLFPEPLGGEVSYSVERSKGTISKTYSRKCVEAEKLFLSEDYAAAVSFLEPVVADICNSPEKIRENTRLLGVFFDAVRQFPESGKTEKYRDFIIEIRKADPGRFSWYLDELFFTYPESHRGYYTTIPRLRDNDTEEILEADKAYYQKKYKDLAEDLPVMEREYKDKWINAQENTESNRALYDLILAQMYVCQWIYHSQGWGASHDADNDGVIAREKALEILNRKEYAENKTFLELHEFTLERIINSGIGFWEAYYYYRGKELYDAEHVQKDLNKVRDKKGDKKTEGENE